MNESDIQDFWNQNPCGDSQVSGLQNRRLFKLGRHLVSAKHYRVFRENAFASWKCVTA